MTDEDVIQAMVHPADKQGHSLHTVVVKQLPLHAKTVCDLGDKGHTNCLS